MSSASLLALALSFLGIFWEKGDRIASISSIIVGSTATVMMYFTGYFSLGIWPSVWCLILSTIVFIMGSLIRFFNYPESKESK